MDDTIFATQWKLGVEIRVGTRILLFIDQITRYGKVCCHTGWLSTSRQPCAIVVVEKDQTRVIGIDRPSWSMDQLRQRITDIDVTLHRLR